MIAQEAGGDHIDPSIILIHAEDQLMSVETFKILAGKFIDLAKKTPNRTARRSVEGPRSRE